MHWKGRLQKNGCITLTRGVDENQLRDILNDTEVSLQKKGGVTKIIPANPAMDMINLALDLSEAGIPIKTPINIHEHYFRIPLNLQL